MKDSISHDLSGVSAFVGPYRKVATSVIAIDAALTATHNLLKLHRHALAAT